MNQNGEMGVVLTIQRQLGKSSLKVLGKSTIVIFTLVPP